MSTPTLFDAGRVPADPKAHVTLPFVAGAIPLGPARPVWWWDTRARPFGVVPRLRDARPVPSASSRRRAAAWPPARRVRLPVRQSPPVHLPFLLERHVTPCEY